MDQKTELLNIYLKIHQKRDLSWEDLVYLARFDKECFEKTCKNVVYNVPQAKPIMLQPQVKTMEEIRTASEKECKTESSQEIMQEEKEFSIEHILENLRHMEAGQLPIADFDADRVKNLLGNLYMELLFPHNDNDSFYGETISERGNFFDKKA